MAAALALVVSMAAVFAGKLWLCLVELGEA